MLPINISLQLFSIIQEIPLFVDINTSFFIFLLFIFSIFLTIWNISFGLIFSISGIFMLNLLSTPDESIIKSAKTGLLSTVIPITLSFLIMISSTQELNLNFTPLSFA